MTATLAHHHSRHGHRRKKRHNIYGMVPGPYGFQLLNRKKNGVPPDTSTGDGHRPEPFEKDLKAQMVQTVWSVESLMTLALFLLFAIYIVLGQWAELKAH